VDYVAGYEKKAGVDVTVDRGRNTYICGERASRHVPVEGEGSTEWGRAAHDETHRECPGSVSASGWRVPQTHHWRAERTRGLSWVGYRMLSCAGAGTNEGDARREPY
jgi:hypothetical protein